MAPLKRCKSETLGSGPALQVGFAWFTREQWQRLTEIADDRIQPDETFEQWECNTLSALYTRPSQGHLVGLQSAALQIFPACQHVVHWTTIVHAHRGSDDGGRDAGIPGSGGVRKLRWALPGRGKRGGARVIYYVHNEGLPLFLLTAYAKNQRGDLSPKDRAELKDLVKQFPTTYERKRRR